MMCTFPPSINFKWIKFKSLHLKINYIIIVNNPWLAKSCLTIRVVAREPFSLWY